MRIPWWCTKGFCINRRGGRNQKNPKTIHKKLFPWIVFAHQIACGQWVNRKCRSTRKKCKNNLVHIPFCKKKSPIQYRAETENTKNITFKRQINLNMAAVRDHYRHMWIVFSALIRRVLFTYLPIHILQKKGQWESNINVLFRFMYFQKWNYLASLFPKQNYNVLSLNFHIHVSVSNIYCKERIWTESPTHSV